MCPLWPETPRKVKTFFTFYDGDGNYYIITILGPKSQVPDPQSQIPGPRSRISKKCLAENEFWSRFFLVEQIFGQKRNMVEFCFVQKKYWWKKKKIGPKNVCQKRNWIGNFFGWKKMWVEICIWPNKVRVKKCGSIKDLSEEILGQILQGLRVAQAAVTERWPSRKIARKWPFFLG